MRYKLATLLLGFSLTAAAADIEGTGVLLQGVDKVTGRTQIAELHVGEPSQFGSIRITPLRCLKKPPEETPENAAFLLVEEEDKHGVYKVIFNGWMFSSNPALSAMEHPIFDIWVLSCQVPDEPSADWTGEGTLSPPYALPETGQTDELTAI